MVWWLTVCTSHRTSLWLAQSSVLSTFPLPYKFWNNANAPGQLNPGDHLIKETYSWSEFSFLRSDFNLQPWCTFGHGRPLDTDPFEKSHRSSFFLLIVIALTAKFIVIQTLAKGVSNCILSLPLTLIRLCSQEICIPNIFGLWCCPLSHLAMLSNRVN